MSRYPANANDDLDKSQAGFEVHLETAPDDQAAAEQASPTNDTGTKKKEGEKPKKSGPLKMMKKKGLPSLRRGGGKNSSSSPKGGEGGSTTTTSSSAAAADDELLAATTAAMAASSLTATSVSSTSTASNTGGGGTGRAGSPAARAGSPTPYDLAVSPSKPTEQVEAVRVSISEVSSSSDKGGHTQQQRGPPKQSKKGEDDNDAGQQRRTLFPEKAAGAGRKRASAPPAFGAPPPPTQVSPAAAKGSPAAAAAVASSMPSIVSPSPSIVDNASFSPERQSFAALITIPKHDELTLSPTPKPKGGVSRIVKNPQPIPPTSWTPIYGTEFAVRKGPNYKKHGKKEQSLHSLYEVVEVRCFNSEKRTACGPTACLPLPTGVGGGDSNYNGDSSSGMDDSTDGEEEDVPADAASAAAENGGGDPLKRRRAESSAADVFPKDEHVPQMLVVHFMLPYESPNMFNKKDDGRGGEVVMYLKPSQRFVDEMNGSRPVTPATRLFAKWCRTCETDLRMRSRFKCMGLVRNIDKHGLGMIKQYNGKPVLITESGSARSGVQGGVRYLEMSANVHHWCFVAKKGFTSLIPKFKQMQLDVGFTIEGMTDEEMPECILGATCMNFVDVSAFPKITPAMQQPHANGGGGSTAENKAKERQRKAAGA